MIEEISTFKERVVSSVILLLTEGKFEFDPIKTTGEIANELNVRNLDQMGKVEKLYKWMPYALNDNHVAQLPFQKLHALAYESLPSPPYSVDHSSTDYQLFKHLDNFLRGKIFVDQYDIVNA